MIYAIGKSAVRDDDESQSNQRKNPPRRVDSFVYGILFCVLDAEVGVLGVGAGGLGGEEDEHHVGVGLGDVLGGGVAVVARVEHVDGLKLRGHERLYGQGERVLDYHEVQIRGSGVAAVADKVVFSADVHVIGACCEKVGSLAEVFLADVGLDEIALIVCRAAGVFRHVAGAVRFKARGVVGDVVRAAEVYARALAETAEHPVVKLVRFPIGHVRARKVNACLGEVLAEHFGQLSVGDERAREVPVVIRAEEILFNLLGRLRDKLAQIIGLYAALGEQ